MCTRVADNLWAFMGKHFTTSPSLFIPLSLSLFLSLSLSLSLSLRLSLFLPLSPSLSLSLSLSISLSLSLSICISLALVRWRYLRCCDFDDFSPSFTIVHQLWCSNNAQLRPFFQILEPDRCWSAPSPVAFHLPSQSHQSVLHTVLPDDVAK